MRNLIEWLHGWWETFQVWRESDDEQWAILTGPFDPDDYVDAPRPHA